ncbi:MAG TPA: helicase C-terminal domain-containing protein [Bacillus sp. (in: firmicutes)]|uniref:helicase C-terminal domain-containing protein n=1 Tax=Bacillus litorisediminis TaxID=2922713 RepID=UPI001FADE5E7|nr:helicase C-terminal domain-containing protein [Bacillus litorisediminis]HWO74525.1 helicase C-terminal domain-containing protein [Bacillus sp. (in: firmicutes)]
MTNIVRISVRGLVEYVYRSGSIDSRFRSVTPLQEGTKIHQAVQSSYKESDEKEVPLACEILFEGLVFKIEGRCDGVIHEENGLMIDEIKSTSRPLAEITEESYLVYWAQAKFYAYILAKEKNLETIKIRLTYVQTESKEIKQFVAESTFKELEAFVYDTVQQYVPFASLLKDHAEKRTESAKKLAFPFPSYRSGQRDFAGAVYKSILAEKKLFAMAPTGTGKTISTTFPAVKALGEGLIDRFFYVTAKTITRTAAEDALYLMKEKGLQCKAVTITAKDKVCFQDETICSKDHCEFADGYYDRINVAILDIFANETMMNREVMAVYARKHRVCPFEFSIDLAYIADAIICDYNYLYDPQVSLKRFFDEQKRKSAVLVDEAHNLVDRAREMFSAQLLKSDFLQLKRDYKGKNSYLFESAKAINEYFLQLKKQCGNQPYLVERVLQEELIILLDTFVAEAERELLEESTSLLLDTYFLAQAFLKTAKLFDERYVTFAEIEKSEVRVKLYCLDPSYLLGQAAKHYRSTIYFSATFMPISFYKDMLGGEKADYMLSIPSPFLREHLELYIQPVSTRYHDRERSKKIIVRTIREVVRKRRGNYLIFFPSYKYMTDVYEECILEDWEGVRTIVQSQTMSETEREEFLASFETGQDDSLVGFAVLGGIFSEGIDLKGDRLTGVIVVGVGLPQIGVDRDLIKDYYNQKGKNGYDYAYVFPGMNKVLQAGGRLIRTEEDQGILVLIEDRFLTDKYQRLLPYEWQHFKVLDESGL